MTPGAHALAEAALWDIRVVDISQGWAGPLVTAILANMGAQVLKIESRQHPDWWRGFPRDGSTADPFSHERSPLFNSINRNKFGCTINLGEPKGRDLLLRLVRVADVLVENFTPRVIERWGITFDIVHRANPHCVMISMPGFGRTGPWRDYPALGTTTDSMSGWASLTGYHGGPPRLQSVSGDPMAGLHGAVAVLIALRHRARTGEGQYIELSHIEACTSVIGPELLAYQLAGRLPARRGNRDGSMAPHGAYPAAGDDQWVTIAVADDEQWHQLCNVSGHPEWATDPRWRTLDDRLRNQDELDAAVAEWTSRSDPLANMAALQAAGVPAGVIHSGASILGDAHFMARDFFRIQNRAHVGSHPYPASPIRMSRTQPVQGRPAPTLGEHNDFVLRDILGLSSAEIGELEKGKITGVALVPRETA